MTTQSKQLGPATSLLLAAAQLYAPTNPALAAHFGFQLNESLVHAQGSSSPLPSAISGTTRQPGSSFTCCQACGAPQIPGVGSRPVLESVRPRLGLGNTTQEQMPGMPAGIHQDAIELKAGNREGGGAEQDTMAGEKPKRKAKRRRPQAAAPTEIFLKTICLHCGRFARTMVEKQPPKRRRQFAQPGTHKTGGSSEIASEVVAVDVEDTGAAANAGVKEVRGKSDRKARQKAKKGGLAAMLAKSKEEQGPKTEMVFGFADLARKG